MPLQPNQPARYWAYFNYVVATARLIERIYPGIPALAAVVAATPSFNALRAHPAADRPFIARLFRSVWFTEIHLSEHSKYQPLLPYSAPWAMVQAYYMIYLAARAYFAIHSRGVPLSHRGTLAALANDLLVCVDRFPSPWRAVCSANPATTAFALSNDPSAPPITLSNPTSSPYTGDPWQHFGLFLRTTRTRALLGAFEEWRKRSKRRRVTAATKATLLGRLPPTTLFDAMYRLRARSNYHDVDPFVFVSVTPSDGRALLQALLTISTYTVALLELMVAKSGGRTWFDNQVATFIGAPTGAPGAQLIGARWAAIRRHV